MLAAGAALQPSHPIPTSHHFHGPGPSPWRHSTMAPAVRYSARKPQDHILNNICAGHQELSDWLLNWMALGVQKPGDPIGTAPVLHGLPGTGKGFLAHAYGRLWGRHYTTVTHQSHVSGRFNAHLFGKRFVFIDEGTFDGGRPHQNAR